MRWHACVGVVVLTVLVCDCYFALDKCCAGIGTERTNWKQQPKRGLKK